MGAMKEIREMYESREGKRREGHEYVGNVLPCVHGLYDGTHGSMLKMSGIISGVKIHYGQYKGRKYL